jgi:hypothetical protein
MPALRIAVASLGCSRLQRSTTAWTSGPFQRERVEDPFDDHQRAAGRVNAVDAPRAFRVTSRDDVALLRLPHTLGVPGNQPASTPSGQGKISRPHMLRNRGWPPVTP